MAFKKANKPANVVMAKDEDEDELDDTDLDDGVEEIQDETPKVSISQVTKRDVASNRSIAMLRRFSPAPTIGGYDFLSTQGIASLELNKRYIVPESVGAHLVSKNAAVFTDVV